MNIRNNSIGLCLVVAIIGAVTANDFQTAELDKANLETPPENLDPIVADIDAAPVAVDDEQPSSGSNSKVECLNRKLTVEEEDSGTKVELINSTGLQRFIMSSTSNNASNSTTNSTTGTSNSTAAECCIIYFYYPWCKFSTQSAPHYNAIGRLYPQLHVLAFDAYANNGINMRFGLVGVPTTLFLHGGRVVAKYNDSGDIRLESLIGFIQDVAGLEPVGTAVLLEEDRLGPVPTKLIPVSFDWWLLLSWTFVFVCALYFLVRSTPFRQLVEWIGNTWREAEAHQHLD